MLRAAMLDASLYRELRTDPMAGIQAVIVVILASIAAAVGIAVDAALSDREVGGAIGLAVLVMPGLWLIQATSALMFGRLSYDRGGQKPTIGEVANSLGYSASPGVLFVFLFIPVAGPVLATLVVFYMLVTMIMAVKSTLSVSTFRAFLAVGPGFLLRLVVVALVAGSGGAAA
jgi:hypothetical protein